jgi:hypothetical protein
MSTSGISYYQLTRDQLLTASIRKLGVLAEGQTPSAQNLSDAALALNSTIAEFRSVGMPLWARYEYTFTPTTSSYTIGVGYTLNTPAPIKLLQAVLTASNNSRIDMEVMARDDFLILPNSSPGSPLKINYRPGINTGTISLWPVPDSTNTSTVTLVYQRPFEYFTTGTETLDFPEEWYNAIIYKVAVLIAPEWGIPTQDRQMLMSEAKQYKDSALEVGLEDGSFFFAPDRMR